MDQQRVLGHPDGMGWKGEFSHCPYDRNATRTLALPAGATTTTTSPAATTATAATSSPSPCPSRPGLVVAVPVHLPRLAHADDAIPLEKQTRYAPHGPRGTTRGRQLPDARAGGGIEQTPQAQRLL